MHIMEHHMAMKVNTLLLHTIIPVNLTNILKERSETQKCLVHNSIFMELEIGKPRL